MPNFGGKVWLVIMRDGKGKREFLGFWPFCVSRVQGRGSGKGIDGPPWIMAAGGINSCLFIKAAVINNHF